jgi:pimeloyl-ACP methyl ester carboxylesterase
VDGHERRIGWDERLNPKKGDTQMLHITLFAAGLFICSGAMAQDGSSGRRVAIHGMQMYYEVSGQGEPLVVLHGAHMNIKTMGRIIPLLAESHRVYAPEVQGHGRTTDIDRPITYQNLADDVAVFMDAVGLEKADVFGYSMGGTVALQLAIRHPAKVDQLIVASVSYDEAGWQPAFKALIPQMTREMFAPFEEEWRKLAPNPDGYAAFVDKMIALEHEPMAWGQNIAAIKAPTLIISGDADAATLEHSVAMFRLLGGGIMGDMGQPLPASRLAIMPATAHTAVINQPKLLLAFIKPFLRGETPKGIFEPGESQSLTSAVTGAPHLEPDPTNEDLGTK